MKVKIWIRGYNKTMKTSKVVILASAHPALTCSIILPSIIKIFLAVAELCSGNENEEKYGSGDRIKMKTCRVVILACCTLRRLVLFESSYSLGCVSSLTTRIKQK